MTREQSCVCHSDKFISINQYLMGVSLEELPKMGCRDISLSRMQKDDAETSPNF